MSYTEFTLTSNALTKRPICPHCDSSMWLVRIEHIGANLCERTFKCPTCEMAPAPQTDAMFGGRNSNGIPRAAKGRRKPAASCELLET